MNKAGNLAMLHGRGDLGIQLADRAEKEIAAALASVAGSNSPCMTHAVGMIDMAAALDLIGAEQRTAMKDQLRRIFNERRSTLHAERMKRLLGEGQ